MSDPYKRYGVEIIQQETLNSLVGRTRLISLHEPEVFFLRPWLVDTFNRPRSKARYLTLIRSACDINTTDI